MCLVWGVHNGGMATDETSLFFQRQAENFSQWINGDLGIELAHLASQHTPSACESFAIDSLEDRTFTKLDGEPTGHTPDPQGFQERWLFKDFYTDTYRSKVTSQNQSPILKTMVEGVLAKQKKASVVKCSQVLIDALLGTARTGNKGLTPVVLPASQKLASNYVASGAAKESYLTFDKILRAAELLQEGQYYSESDDLVLIVTPAALNSVMREIAGSSAFNQHYVEKGAFQYLAGFKLVKSMLLPGARGDVTCIAYNRKLAAMARWSDENVFDVSKLNTDHMKTQVYSRFACAAGRLAEDGVVSIACKRV